jgi:hypothetical protein
VRRRRLQLLSGARQAVDGADDTGGQGGGEHERTLLALDDGERLMAAIAAREHDEEESVGDKLKALISTVHSPSLPLLISQLPAVDRQGQAAGPPADGCRRVLISAAQAVRSCVCN